MAVPETTVNENGRAVFAQSDVGLAWQMLDIHAVTESFGKQIFPHHHLGLCVFAFDLLHDVAALFGCENVCHGG